MFYRWTKKGWYDIMKTTINQWDFINSFAQCNREDNFSYLGKIALFENFEEYEDDCDIEIELDAIAICCEYTEYENLEEFHNDYGSDDYPDFDTIEQYTQVIQIEGNDSFIIQCF